MKPTFFSKPNNTHYKQTETTSNTVNFTQKNQSIINPFTPNKRIRTNKPSKVDKPLLSPKDILPDAKGRNPIFKFLNPTEKARLALTCRQIFKDISDPFFIGKLLVRWKKTYYIYALLIKKVFFKIILIKK